MSGLLIDASVMTRLPLSAVCMSVSSLVYWGSEQRDPGDQPLVHWCTGKVRKIILSRNHTSKIFFVVICVIRNGDDCFLCLGSILLSLVYFWRCGQIRSGPVSSGWVTCVVLIRPLRDCRGRQQMLVGVNHSALNIPHVWNTMTTQSRHNTHT